MTSKEAEAYNELMLADALAFIDFLQKNIDRMNTLSALFDGQGNRIDGSDIELERVGSSSPHIWYYRVIPQEGYVFIPVPVTACYIDHATPHDTLNPVDEVFRFVDNPMATFQQGGAPNLIVSFSVIGYKPAQLLNRASQ